MQNDFTGALATVAAPKKVARIIRPMNCDADQWQQFLDDMPTPLPESWGPREIRAQLGYWRDEQARATRDRASHVENLAREAAHLAARPPAPTDAEHAIPPSTPTTPSWRAWCFMSLNSIAGIDLISSQRFS